MAKFKKGQKCKIIHSLLDPTCIGMEVTIKEVASEKIGMIIYVIDLDGIERYASESCLELIE